MGIMSLIEGLSLVELMIYGFIGANMLLSGAYLLQVGVQKRGGPKSEL